MNKFFSNPARVIVSSFGFLILLGTFLLMLPISNHADRGLNFIDALFTATSATCVTGLIVVDTYSHFTMFGHIVILSLIQLGGLGLVSFATFFNLVIRKKIGYKSLQTAGESVSNDSFHGVNQLLKTIFTMTLLIELVGALALMTVLVPKFGCYGVFASIFIAVSAYCNAGFDVLGFIEPYSSLTSFNDSPIVLIVVMLLILSGGIGFIVWNNIITYHKTKKLTLHTKIVLWATVSLVVVGTLSILMTEYHNPQTIGNMPFWQKLLNSMFMSVSTRTAGFNTFPIENMNAITKSLFIFFMFIGAAPGSTGGGIKVTTFYVLVMTCVCVLAGKSDTIIHKRVLDKAVVYKSMTVVSVAVTAVMISTCTMYFTTYHLHPINEIDALFEAVSAFATVGLSSGMTAVINPFVRIILIVTMFLGRVGPVSLALSLALREKTKSKIMPEAKIMVG